MGVRAVSLHQFGSVDRVSSSRHVSTLLQVFALLYVFALRHVSVSDVIVFHASVQQRILTGIVSTQKHFWSPPSRKVLQGSERDIIRD